jgi:hypothetical protein
MPPNLLPEWEFRESGTDAKPMEISRMIEVVENENCGSKLVPALSLRRDKNSPWAGTRNSLRNTQRILAKILKTSLNLRRILGIMAKNNNYSPHAGTSAPFTSLSRAVIAIALPPYAD